MNLQINKKHIFLFYFLAFLFTFFVFFSKENNVNALCISKSGHVIASYKTYNDCLGIQEGVKTRPDNSWAGSNTGEPQDIISTIIANNTNMKYICYRKVDSPTPTSNPVYELVDCNISKAYFRYSNPSPLSDGFITIPFHFTLSTAVGVTQHFHLVEKADTLGDTVEKSCYTSNGDIKRCAYSGSACFDSNKKSMNCTHGTDCYDYMGTLVDCENWFATRFSGSMFDFIFSSTTQTILWFGLATFLTLKATISGIQIVKAAEEPDTRSKKIKGMVQAFIGVAIVAAILLISRQLYNYYNNYVN